jgi:hypothetical protein
VCPHALRTTHCAGLSCLTALACTLTARISCQQVQTLLRGPAGSEVTLSILRSDQEGQLEKMDMTVKRNEELGRIRRSKAREDAQEQLKARKEEEFTARQKMASQEAKQAAESESSGLSFFGLPVASVRHAHEKSLVKSPETLERDLLTDAHLSSPKAQQRTHKAEERMLIDALAAARESFDPSDLAASQAQVARTHSLSHSQDAHSHALTLSLTHSLTASAGGARRRCPDSSTPRQPDRSAGLEILR